jgi:hypothetical protein
MYIIMYYIYAMGSAVSFVLMIITAMINGMMYSKPALEDLSESLVEEDVIEETEEDDLSQPEEES